ncbi:MAG TPA: outer membrane protein assembly factor BamA [Pseudolabrys sp.]|nr:outer membrane protein assembly factor BamA [Pseudolabrys sp.]
MVLCVRWARGLALSIAVLGGLLVSAGVATIASSSVALAQSANSIVVEGNRRVEAATVRSYFKAGPGGQFGPAEIDEGIKALYGTGLFSDVRINRSGGRIIVTVVENPVINRVAFEGNKKAKDTQLEAEVQSKPRGTFSKPTVQADVQRILEIYHHTGYFDVTVVPKVIELPNNRVDLVFEISEGKKTTVKEIRFNGLHAFSGNRLKRVIKTTETNFLSFLQSTNIYDADRVEADRDLLRRFYLSHGYADVRIISAIGEYDPAQKGFIITFNIDEGPQYHVGTVEVVSNVRLIDPAALRGKLRLSPGNVYNADLVQKSVEAMTIEAAKNGYAFANVRPRGDRDFQNKVINLVFVVEEGTRAYIERINIIGNTRTRDYVIRREFDIGEGDPYNRALIDRAERRLKNLNFFKTVKITNEPGSAPDRVVVNVNVEEKPTGEFSISGGYSTANGWLSEISIADRNLFGRGQFAKASLSYGQYSKGFQVSFVEPYLLGYRMAGGIDIYGQQNLATSYVSYNSETVGVNLRLGFALTEELSLQPHYSIYRQDITLPDFANCWPSGKIVASGLTCTPASLPIRLELANGPVTVSLVGYTLTYNTLDNINSPTSGMVVAFTNDLAGVGGDVNFIRTNADLRNYYEVLPDVVGVLHLQAGHETGWGGKDLRMLDHFFMGPNLVRGFAPAGLGPRDLTNGTTNDALGGSVYWGSSLEFQTPLYFLPREIGLKFAVFADAGSLWNYQGPTSGAAPPGTPFQTVQVGLDKFSDVRSSIGAGIIWDSPLGPLRVDVAYPLTQYCEKNNRGVDICDRTQIFRFSGGAKF